MIPQEKYIDEMKIGTSSICWLFFMKKAPDLLPHEYDFFLVKNKTYTGEEQNSEGVFLFSFSFWTHKKKHFTQKPILTQKVFASTRSCWSSGFCCFLSQNWFLCEMFFCMFETKRKIGKRLQRFVPHLYRFCFLPKKIIFMRQKVGGFFHEK